MKVAITLRVMSQGRVTRSVTATFARRLRRLCAGGMLAFMSDVTRILSAIEEGDPSAAEQLLPLVYASASSSTKCSKAA